jgi:hypothetical protein
MQAKEYLENPEAFAVAAAPAAAEAAPAAAEAAAEEKAEEKEESDDDMVRYSRFVKIKNSAYAVVHRVSVSSTRLLSLSCYLLSRTSSNASDEQPILSTVVRDLDVRNYLHIDSRI